MSAAASMASIVLQAGALSSTRVTASDVGWLGATGEDITAQFHAAVGTATLAGLEPCEILTVPGIFTAWYPRYFAAIERGLAPLRVRRSRIDTEGTVEDNARTL